MTTKLKTLYFCAVCDVTDNVKTAKDSDVQKWIKKQDEATLRKYYGEGEAAYVTEVMQLDWNSAKYFVTDRIQINNKWIYLEDLDSSVK